MIFQKTYAVTPTQVDRFDRLKLSGLMAMVQETAGEHSALLGADRQALTEKGLFWAVIRHRVQITRLPSSGEEISVETWPMPTTRTAYPRAAVAYDKEGRELFRAISLWVLMDTQKRAMVLPGKSGVEVNGLIRGQELALPGSIVPQALENTMPRTVRFSELDINGHMNNCRYTDWLMDLLPGDFHREHAPAELLICYVSEAREGQNVALNWTLDGDGCLHTEAQNQEGTGNRVFSARLKFDSVL